LGGAWRGPQKPNLTLLTLWQNFSRHLLSLHILGGGILLAVIVSQYGMSTKGQREELSQQRKFVALEFARLLGAISIVNHHFQKMGDPVASVWLAFFFIVSGLGTATSRLSSYIFYKDASITFRDTLPSPRVLYRRVASVYPTYLFALAVTVGIDALLRFRNALHLAPVTVGSVTEEALLMGTVFAKDDFSFPYNYPDWFVSALAFCWLFENAIFYMVECLHRFLGAMVIVVAFVLAYGANCYLMYLGFCCTGNWWQGLPSYFLGVALAFAIKFEHIPSSLNSVAATLAILLMLMFSFGLPPDFRYTAKSMSLYVAAALPVPFLMVIGLCGTSDPLAKLFALSPLPALGTRLSMSMYLLNRPTQILCKSLCIMLFPQHHATEWSMTVAYLILLASISFFVGEFIHIPLQRIMLRVCQP